jgi:hypothetical protein
MSKHHFLNYENKHQPLLPRAAFVRRLTRNFAIASLLVGFSLFGGMVGYKATEGMSWMDAFVNASMILSGMGPLDAPKTWGGKLFAGLYALYSGLLLLLASSIVLAPVVHRLFHRFHLEEGKTN